MPLPQPVEPPLDAQSDELLRFLCQEHVRLVQGQMLLLDGQANLQLTLTELCHSLPSTPGLSNSNDSSHSNDSTRDSAVAPVSLPSGSSDKSETNKDRPAVDTTSEEGDDGTGHERGKRASLMSRFSQVEPPLPAWKWSAYMQKAVDILPPIVITLNCMTLGLSTDICIKCEFWDVLEVIFTLFYLVEFLCKLKILGCRGYFCSAGWYWNWFDFYCLTLGISEFFLTTFLRWFGIHTYSGLEDIAIMKVLRLSRLMRTIRALKFKAFTELKLMLLGILNGLTTLVWAIALLFVVIYVLAIFLRNLIGADDQDLPEFRHMTASMFTLYRCFTDGCDAYNGSPIGEILHYKYGTLFVIGYTCVMMLVSVGLFNMIFAIFIDQAASSAVRRKQRELSVSAATTERKMKCIIAQLATDPSVLFENHRLMGSLTWDNLKNFTLKARAARAEHSIRANELLFRRLRDEGLTIGRQQFNEWLEVQQFQDLLENSGIDTSHHADIFDILDSDMGGSLDLDEIVKGLMKLRGPVTKNDIIAIRMKVRFLSETMRAKRRL